MEGRAESTIETGFGRTHSVLGTIEENSLIIALYQKTTTHLSMR